MTKCLILCLLGLSLGSYCSFAAVKKTNCLHKKNTLCRSMLKLNPEMDPKKAYHLSNIFSQLSKKYKIDPKLILSIAFQESSFKLDAVRKVTGLIYDIETSSYKTMRVGSDFCMMQIHISNIKKMNLNVKKLLKNPRYCIENGVKILAKYKRRFSKKTSIWWTHYNAKTKAKQKIYLNKVSKHLNKIQKKSSVIKRREVASAQTRKKDEKISKKTELKFIKQEDLSQFEDMEFVN